jgi:hypothetical protein
MVSPRLTVTLAGKNSSTARPRAPLPTFTLNVVAAEVAEPDVSSPAPSVAAAPRTIAASAVRLRIKNLLLTDIEPPCAYMSAIL